MILLSITLLHYLGQEHSPLCWFIFMTEFLAGMSQEKHELPVTKALEQIYIYLLLISHCSPFPSFEVTQLVGGRTCS